MKSNNMLMVSAVSFLALVATDALANGKGLGRDGAPGQSAQSGQPDHAGGGKKGGDEGGGPGSPAGSGFSDENPSEVSGTPGNKGKGPNSDRGNAGGPNGHDNDDNDDHDDDDDNDDHDDDDDNDDHDDDDDQDDHDDDVTPDTPRVTVGGGSGGNAVVCASGETVASLAPTMVGRDLDDRYLVLQNGVIVGFVNIGAMQHGLTYRGWTYESSVDADTVCVDDVKMTLSEPAQSAPKSNIEFEGHVVNMNGS